jgi:hypothetical protein
MTQAQDRSRILALIGVPLLLVGLACAVLGPVEIYCFYLFSDGGPFYYEGFGFGSFMFGNIAWQIIGYYLIALLCIPLGYAHLKTRRWARTVALTLLYSWLVLGVPLTCVFLFILFSSKDLSPVVALFAIVLLALSYLLVPGLLIRFYQSRDVRWTFETRDPSSYWIERQPLPVLVLCFLLIFYTIVLHVPIFFRGIFPLFGTWLSGLEGIVVITISILSLAWLTWGVFRLRAWAWWGSLVYVGLLTLSSVLTLATSSLDEMLAILSFPPTEMEALQGVPLQGIHFVPLIGLPLLLTVGVIILSRRHFGQIRLTLL